MFKDIGVVVPALEKNRYSPFGDLVKFGGSTLLEWKIVQLLKIVEKENIYISTPSEKIEAVAKEYGINVIKRKENSTIQDMMDRSIKGIDKKYILWTNATSPFIGPRHYNEIINRNLNLDRNKYDSVITVLKMQEYIMYKNSPLNFNIAISELRRDIEPVYKITNGCSIADRDTCCRYGKDFGVRPFLYEVDKFASMEISEIDDDTILNDLVAHYFRKDLDIVDKDLWKH
jgi:CMP-N-acetylneuraminic acid synthetase